MQAAYQVKLNRVYYDTDKVCIFTIHSYELLAGFKASELVSQTFSWAFHSLFLSATWEAIKELIPGFNF